MPRLTVPFQPVMASGTVVMFDSRSPCCSCLVRTACIAGSVVMPPIDAQKILGEASVETRAAVADAGQAFFCMT